MKPFRDLSIRHKLVVMTLVTSAAALFLTEGGFLVWDTIRFRSDVRQDVDTLTRIVAENSAAPLAFGDERAAGETLAVLELRPRVSMACLYEQSGRLFATYHRDAESACPSATSPANYGWTAMQAVVPVQIDGAEVGTLYVNRELSDMYARLRVGLAMALALLLMAGGAAFLLAVRFQRSISAPLLNLAATARTISSSRDYSIRAAPGSRDEIGVVVGAFNDMLGRIAERNAELSRANEDLRDANRLKDEFLATLSHELRTPLNAVLGWTRVLRTARVEPATQARALESIERNAQAQTRLIEDLLEVSRIVTGKLRLNVRPVDLAAIVDAAVEVIQPAATAKRIHLSSEIAVRPAMTSGDPDRLQQIIWNLLSNAVKFTPPDGHVSVHLGLKDGYRLSVRDSGIGIEPRFLPHLFEAFRQADGTPTREQGGLGLGLAIAKQLAELHGGSVKATSDGHDAGATFEVFLPSVITAVTEGLPVRHGSGAPTAAPGPASHVAPLLLRDMHVLVVDDEEDARALLEATLTHYGASVTTAASAHEALDAIDQVRPDVLLSDIGMPHEDGYSLIRRLRARAASDGGLIPAVALTAYASDRDRHAALEAGFQAHIAKPFEPDDVAAMVAKLGKR